MQTERPSYGNTTKQLIAMGQLRIGWEIHVPQPIESNQLISCRDFPSANVKVLMHNSTGSPHEVSNDTSRIPCRVVPAGVTRTNAIDGI
jgi:hypothetical protein